jgi:hypothetical protein
MTYLNAALGAAVDLLLLPFERLPALAGLAVVSLLTAIGMLIVFKKTSRQDRLEAVKRRIHAALFEMRLFADDLPALFRAQGEILLCNLSYLRLSLVPLLWMIVPITLLLAQLQMHYGYAGLEPGRPVIVKVKLGATAPVGGADGEAGAKPPASLEAPDGVRVETPALWIPSLRELDWRIAADRPGDYDLTIRLAQDEVTKAVRVSSGLGRRSPVRVERGLVGQLLYPSEPPIPDGVPIESIEVGYPGRSVSLFGWGLPWLVVFFVLTMVFALALRKRFGVVI